LHRVGPNGGSRRGWKSGSPCALGRGRSKNRGHLLRQEGSAAKTEAMLTQTRVAQQKPGSGMRGRRERSKNGDRLYANRGRAAKTGVRNGRSRRAQQKRRQSLPEQSARTKNRGTVCANKVASPPRSHCSAVRGSRHRPGTTVRLGEGRVAAAEPFFGHRKGAQQKRGPSLRKERLRSENRGHLYAKKGRVAAIEPVFRVWKAPSSPRSEALPAESRNMRAVGPMSVPVKACPFAYCLGSFSVAPAKPFALRHFR
jgi:hypothetical protein